MRPFPSGFLAALTVSVLAAGCVPRAVPPPVPAPRPVAPPAPAPRPAPLASDWRDWPVTPGDWTYRQDARGSVALFGPRGQDALMVLRCDPGRRTVYLSVSGSVAMTATFRTSSLTRAVALTPTGGEPAYLAAEITPADPLLDAMGFSRGRFAIVRPGAQPLVIPAWPEIERVTQDCRA